MLLLGVPAHLRGYQYLREAIFIVATLPDTRHQVAKVVYERIAGEHGVTASTVERAVRHAIETAWDRGDMDTMDQILVTRYRRLRVVRRIQSILLQLQITSN